MPFGRTTKESLQSGLFWGYIGLVEGLLKRLKQEMSGTPIVIITGGLAPLIGPHIKTVSRIQPDLTLIGLRLIWDMNNRHGGTMILRKGVAVVCLFNLLGSSVEAATAPAGVVAQVNTELSADSALVSGWMSDQLKYAVPFNSTSGNVVPSQLKIFGFEFGVDGVVSGTKLDVDGLHTLNTTLVDVKSLDTFSRLPVPLILAHAKIGLPFGLDAGVRLGGIPKTEENSGNSRESVKNKVFGLDLRKKIIDEGALKPFGLTMGLNYTHATGSADLTNTYDSLQTTVNGHTVSVTDGMTAEHADWKTDSIGLQAILDKKILFMTPYIGASINRNSGHINNSITTTGTPVIDGSVDSDPADALNATGTARDDANKWDVRGLVGLEFSILPFVRLGLQGEYAGSKSQAAAALGLRIQFR